MIGLNVAIFSLSLAFAQAGYLLETTSSAENHHLRGTSRHLQVPYYSTTNLGQVNPDAAAGNPMKGLMTSPDWHGSSYNQDIPSSLEFYYIRVKDVLVADPDIVGVENAYDWSALESRLVESASRQKHAIPRFFLHYPNNEFGVPDYLVDKGVVNLANDLGPDYANPVLLNDIEQFIQEISVKYDGDKRIAFLQLGILGRWGEWNVSSRAGTLPDSSKEAVASWYSNYFSKTKLQARYPTPSLNKVGFGHHDDSFAYSTLDGVPNGGVTKSWYFWPRVVNAGRTDFWKSDVMGGETRPELQSTVFSSNYPAVTENHQDFDVCVETTHTTYMLNSRGFKMNEDAYSGETLEKARRSSARMGYNFHASQVDVMQSATNTVDVMVAITQVGVAPFYYPLGLARLLGP